MSSHSYRTTTVEYYEYEIPETREYSYESLSWPFHSAISPSFVTRPLTTVNHLSDPLDHLSMAGDNNQHSELIYDMAPCRQRPTVYEFNEPEEEPHLTNTPPNPRYEDQHDTECETGDGDASESEPASKPKPKGKKHIYRTKQGYLVEEPTSESEEDQEGTS